MGLPYRRRDTETRRIRDTFDTVFEYRNVEVEEQSYQEIAATLKIKVGTVRSRIARARSMLQQMLWEHALETGIKMKKKPKKKEVECDC